MSISPLGGAKQRQDDLNLRGASVGVPVLHDLHIEGFSRRPRHERDRTEDERWGNSRCRVSLTRAAPRRRPRPPREFPAGARAAVDAGHPQRATLGDQVVVEGSDGSLTTLDVRRFGVTVPRRPRWNSQPAMKSCAHAQQHLSRVQTAGPPFHPPHALAQHSRDVEPLGPHRHRRQRCGPGQRRVRRAHPDQPTAMPLAAHCVESPPEGASLDWANRGLQQPDSPTTAGTFRFPPANPTTRGSRSDQQVLQVGPCEKQGHSNRCTRS